MPQLLNHDFNRSKVGKETYVKDSYFQSVVFSAMILEVRLLTAHFVRNWAFQGKGLGVTGANGFHQKRNG